MQIIKTQCPHCEQAHDAYIQPTVAPQVTARMVQELRAENERLREALAQYEDKSAALLAELEAARAVVEVARANHEIGGASWFADELAAYDASVKARGE